MLTVEQYEKALQSIGPKHKSILKKLYLHGKYENRKSIARSLELKGYGETNLNIGTLGKYFSKETGSIPDESYIRNGKPHPAYFSLVYHEINGGWQLVPNLRMAIDKMEWDMLDESIVMLETEEQHLTSTMFKDGKLIRVFVNRYERDPKARRDAEKIHGSICVACKINFKKMYGSDIKDIIHFHHVQALGEVQKEKAKDIAKDLCPLCPNCHSVVHSADKLMSIVELQNRIKHCMNSIS